MGSFFYRGMGWLGKRLEIVDNRRMSKPGITLNFAPEDRFSCTNCGKCCIVPWAARVLEREASTIRELECYGRLEREGYHALEVVEEQLHLGRDSGYRCYFLGQDGLCDIHREEGAAAKPAVCRLYPYSLINTPDGYFVSLMYTCPAVISGTGGELESGAADLLQTMSSTPEYFPPEHAPTGLVTMVAGLKVDWRSYLDFEKRLLCMLREGSELVNSVLEGAVEAVFAAEGREGDAGLVRLLRERLEEMMPTVISRVVAALEDEQDERPRLAEAVLSGSFESRFLGGRMEGLAGGRVQDLLLDQVLHRYVRSKIWGKVLLTGPTMLARLLSLAISLEVYHLYYREKARREGKRHFSLEVAEWTFDLLEADLLEQDEVTMPLVKRMESYLLEAVRGASRLEGF